MYLPENYIDSFGLDIGQTLEEMSSEFDIAYNNALMEAMSAETLCESAEDKEENKSSWSEKIAKTFKVFMAKVAMFFERIGQSVAALTGRYKKWLEKNKDALNKITVPKKMTVGQPFLMDLGGVFDSIREDLSRLEEIAAAIKAQKSFSAVPFVEGDDILKLRENMKKTENVELSGPDVVKNMEVIIANDPIFRKDVARVSKLARMISGTQFHSFGGDIAKFKKSVSSIQSYFKTMLNYHSRRLSGGMKAGNELLNN